MKVSAVFPYQTKWRSCARFLATTPGARFDALGHFPSVSLEIPSHGLKVSQYLILGREHRVQCEITRDLHGAHVDVPSWRASLRELLLFDCGAYMLGG